MGKCLIIDDIQFKDIENIIFDLGGVIVKIDYSEAKKMFEKIGIKDIDNFFNHNFQSSLFDNFDKGNISSTEFQEEFSKLFSANTPPKELFEKAWNSIIVEIPHSNIQLLKKLKTEFKIYLLSNTNEIHQNYLNDMLRKQYNIANIAELFEKIYCSYQLGMRKPDLQIFEKVIEDAKIDPVKTLFIDDTPANIESARKLEFKTFLMPRDKVLSEIITIC
jgi:putative hydrolase of the HAD superfamily